MGGLFSFLVFVPTVNPTWLTCSTLEKIMILKAADKINLGPWTGSSVGKLSTSINITLPGQVVGSALTWSWTKSLEWRSLMSQLWFNDGLSTSNPVAVTALDGVGADKSISTGMISGEQASAV
jgi:hypothetical protein